MCDQRSKAQRFFRSIVNRSFSVWRMIIVFATLVGSLGLSAFSYGRSQSYAIADGNYGSEGTTESVLSFNRAVLESKIKSVSRLDDSTGTGENYCKVEHCEIVTCTNIPDIFDPGQVVARFVTSSFKPVCTTNRSLKLVLSNCKFASNKIVKNWLPIDVPVERLEINTCSLTDLSDDAFSGPIFEGTTSISLINNRISTLRRNVFLPLGKIQELLIEENTIVTAESNLLKDVANTLQTLSLSAAISDAEVLRNITGQESLKNLRLLYLRRNAIPTIDREMFLGVGGISSLYLDNSGIVIVEPDAFEPLARSLKQLFMDKNDITILPEGTFDRVIVSNPKFRATIADNPWHCDCSLRWMKDFVRRYPTTINVVPTCHSPRRNALLSFLRANFCNETVEENAATGGIVTTTVSGSQDQNEKTDVPIQTEKDVVRVSCTDPEESHVERVHATNAELTIVARSLFESDFSSRTARRRLLSYENYEFPRLFENFSAVERDDGTIVVTIPNQNAGLALLWFNNQVLSSSLGRSEAGNVIQCVKDLRHVSYRLKDIQPANTYTMCLINAEERNVSPLNCLALTTSPRYESQAWLLNEDKTITIGTYMFLLLLLCALSALGMYATVRRHPTLLRGSKRVVIVKHRKLDTLVLPKNMQNNLKKETELKNVCVDETKPKDEGYLTPLPTCKNVLETPPLRTLCRNDSRMSRMSLHSVSNSYISGIEPTGSQLMAWRLERMKDEVKQDDIELQTMPEICRMKQSKLEDCLFPEMIEDDLCKRIALRNVSVPDSIDRDDVYVTPSTTGCQLKGSTLNGPCRKDSRASTMSLHSFANSYVSVVEPTCGQLPPWKLMRMKSETRCEDIDPPPPLPPCHPKQCCASSKYLRTEAKNRCIPEEPYNVL